MRLSKSKATKFNQQKTLYSTQTVVRVKHYSSVETGCAATLTIHGVMPGCNSSRPVRKSLYCPACINLSILRAEALLGSCLNSSADMAIGTGIFQRQRMRKRIIPPYPCVQLHAYIIPPRQQRVSRRVCFLMFL